MINLNQATIRNVMLGAYLAGTLSCCKPAVPVNSPETLAAQFSILLEQTDTDYELEKQQGGKRFFPRSLTEQGRISYVKSGDWCSGFFSGCLWYLADYTGDGKWKIPAQKYTEMLADEQWNKTTHDMGFKIMCSYGNALWQTGNKDYGDVIVQSAKTLITRYNDTIGCIRSWDFNTEQWSFPVIIDNMMNLELLFKATELTGDSIYYRIAVRHADTTLKNHFRPDYSSYHVVDYVPETGQVHERVTHQGDGDDSAWARGQAWGLYGYVMCYRFTHQPAYLQQAQEIARYIFGHPNLPADKIPMWDFNYTEQSTESRDVSAAAIIASALLELSGYVGEKSAEYKTLAGDILNTLGSKYALHNGERWGYLLDHSVGFRHRNHEVDVPLVYADYYYLEALIRQRNIQKRSFN
ncbi:MAG: glycoside hydrolase family 88 protein [Breznakibacter sp.]